MNSCWLFLLFLDIYAREFDENLMSSISLVYYEDDVENLPPSPDVSNYVSIEVIVVRTLSLLTYCTEIYNIRPGYICLQDPGVASNGNINAPPIIEGMCGGEVERRLNQAVSKTITEM